MKFPFLVFLTLPFIAKAGEILIHEGPTVASPGLGIQLPGGVESSTPDIIFIKQFFADEKLLAPEKPDAGSKKLSRIPATEAISLALATMQPNDSESVYVSKVELLPLDPENPLGGDFHLITISVNGSEEHRLVLHSGSVIEPRLKRVE